MRKTIPALIGILFLVLLSPVKFMGAEEESLPKVFLNHFFLMIDAKTYKDIVTSDFIKNEFAHFEERTTVVNDNESYSGAYLYGENTYFEVFNEGNPPDGMPPGAISGMAFGVDRSGELKLVQARLKDYKNAMYVLRTREYQGTQVPWFFMSGVFYGKDQPQVFTWIMEYHPDFLKKWHPDLNSQAQTVQRKAILQRYAAKLSAPEAPRPKLFKDIIEMNLNVNEKDRDILKAEMSVYGYTFTETENTLICKGPSIRFVMNLIEGETGKITGIKMSLNPGQYQAKTYRFGESSRLILYDDNTTAWVFY
jgi:hypothetical protein